MNYEEPLTPYRKKSKKKGLPRSNHKHDYQPCVYEYQFEHWSLSEKITTIGSYCKICGKINLITPDGFAEKPSAYHMPGFERYTDAGKRELNPETRTLPTFWLEDYLKHKFVEIQDDAHKKG